MQGGLRQIGGENGRYGLVYRDVDFLVFLDSGSDLGDEVVPVSKHRHCSDNQELKPLTAQENLFYIFLLPAVAVDGRRFVFRFIGGLALPVKDVGGGKEDK